MKVFVTHENESSKAAADDSKLQISAVLADDDFKFTRLNINNILDCVEYNKRSEILMQFLGKIRYNGLIIISGIDLLGLIKKTANGVITMPEFNEMLSTFISFDSNVKIVEALTQHNMVIEKVKLDNISYYIEARREGPPNDPSNSN